MAAKSLVVNTPNFTTILLLTAVTICRILPSFAVFTPICQISSKEKTTLQKYAKHGILLHFRKENFYDPYMFCVPRQEYHVMLVIVCYSTLGGQISATGEWDYYGFTTNGEGKISECRLL